MFRRFAVEPGAGRPGLARLPRPAGGARRFAIDGYLGTDDGRLAVEAEVAGERAIAGFVSWRSGLYGGTATHWEIGIALLPEWRGRGLGWRAQAMLCDYLFWHTPAQRIQAGTQVENTAEQKSLSKAGFQLEGRDPGVRVPGRSMADGYLYSRLRDDPSPLGERIEPSASMF